MTETFAVVCDCHGTAGFDRNAVADAIGTTHAMTTTAVEERVDDIVEAARRRPYEAAVVVCGNDDAVHTLTDAFAAHGIDAVATVDPFLGSAHPKRVATPVVAATARAALAGARPEPTSAGETRDDVVVVGDADLAEQLASTVDVTLVADRRDLSDRRLDGVRVVRGRPVAVQGRDGFEVAVESRVTDACTGCGRCVRDHPVDTTGFPVDVTGDVPASACPHGAIVDEPVLTPVPGEQVVWSGYDGPNAGAFGVHTDVVSATAAVTAVNAARSRDPARVDADTCAVGRRGQDGCSACADACPHDAITLDVTGPGAVTVDADRCVACGACTAACPTGAISVPRARPLADLVTMTDVVTMTMADADGGSLLRRRRGPGRYAVAFTSGAGARAVELAARLREFTPTVPLSVASANCVSPALLVYAVVTGADAAVVVADATESADRARENVAQANRVLDALGVDARAGLVASQVPDDVADAVEALVPPESTRNVSVDHLEPSSNHDLLLATADAYAAAGHVHGNSLGLPYVGIVDVDADSCTLCPTCSTMCPTDALERTDDTLVLDPSACVGCGLCEASCPEAAIAVSPTVELPDREPTVLAESESAVCSECGQPFASASGIGAVQQALAGTGMLEAVDLSVCPDCRRRGGTF